MAKIKGKGYPTYVIIKAHGTYELFKAGYPMARDLPCVCGFGLHAYYIYL